MSSLKNLSKIEAYIDKNVKISVSYENASDIKFEKNKLNNFFKYNDMSISHKGSDIKFEKDWNASSYSIPVNIEIKNDKKPFSFNKTSESESYSESVESKSKLTSLLESGKDFLDKTKQSVAKIKSGLSGVSEGYKKFNKIAQKTFLSLVVVGTLMQGYDVAHIAHDTGYEWDAFSSQVVEKYEPSWNDFKDKNIYKICERDASLCFASSSVVAYSATKGIGIAGTGTSIAAHCVLTDSPCTSLNDFLMSIEKATGFILTEESSNALNKENTDMLINNLPVNDNKEHGEEIGIRARTTSDVDEESTNIRKINKEIDGNKKSNPSSDSLSL